ncbi:MAG: YcxB family protein [Clostridia bacterium]|nr:YcxB family protein [Clostridia bacterium]
MENRFVVKATFDLDAAKAVDRATNRAFHILLWLVTALTIVLAAVMIFVFKDEDKLFWGLICGWFVVLSLGYRLLNPRLMLRSYNKKVGEVTYSFGEDALRLDCAVENSTVQYPALVKLVEAKDYFLVYPQKRAAFALPKAGFVQGNAADFLPFIEQKTGLTAKRG